MDNSKDIKTESTEEATYSQIFKSSSILGGAQGLNYLIAMGRTKVVAILLGPSGIGLVSIYQSLVAMANTVGALGIPSSGVREIAEASSAGDRQRFTAANRLISRLSWITGLSSWLLVALLSWPLSQWIFHSTERGLGIAVLGASILFTLLSGGQAARLEGVRRIGDIARINIYSMIVSTLAAIAIYAWLHERGIIPVMIISAVIAYAFSSWYAAKLPAAQISIDPEVTRASAKRMISLGLAFMWSGVLGALVAFATRILIVRHSGVEANGIYQAAWGISGMFVGFILAAMGTDFYPRLTEASSDNARMNRMVNEQTEVGILLSIPGLVGTMIYAPLLMKVFYSSHFLAGADLLPWFVLGAFLKVISWPMGFILLAKGETRWFTVSETVFNLLQFTLTAVFLKYFSLPGTSYAFALAYIFQIGGMLILSRKISVHRWRKETAFLLIASGFLLAVAFFLTLFVTQGPTMLFGGIIVIISCFISSHGIVHRLGKEHRLSKILLMVPGIKYLTKTP